MIDIVIGMDNAAIIASVFIVPAAIGIVALVLRAANRDGFRDAEKERQEKETKEQAKKAKRQAKYAEKLEARAQRLAKKKIEDAIVEERSQEILRDTFGPGEEDEES